MISEEIIEYLSKFSIKKTLKSIGSTFLNGAHYLVDAMGNLMKLKETVSESSFFIESRNFKR